MKKTILVLLFLLFALIVTCVYQKTYTIYSLQNTESLMISETVETDTSTTPIKKETVPTVKTEKNTLIVPIPVKVTPVPQATKPSTVQKSAPKVIVEKVVPSVKKAEKPLVKTKEAQAKTNIEEKEVVDYLLSILNDRDLALKERDAVEINLHALIKQALENRRIVIQQMEENARLQEKNIQTLLEARDTASKASNNERKGK